MCLYLSKDPVRDKKNFKWRQGKKITAYKTVNSDGTSGFYCFQWKVGLNVSDRRSARLTQEEIGTKKVNKGFHLALEEPEECLLSDRCRCQCPRPYLCRCRYLCNKVLKCEIDPKDIVGIGTWNGIKSVACIKATVIEEVK